MRGIVSVSAIVVATTALLSAGHGVLGFQVAPTTRHGISSLQATALTRTEQQQEAAKPDLSKDATKFLNRPPKKTRKPKPINTNKPKPKKEAEPEKEPVEVVNKEDIRYRAKSRRARNKQWLMRKWKNQNAHQKNKLLKEAGLSGSVSAIGVDFATMQRNGTQIKGVNKNSRTSQANKKGGKRPNSTNKPRQPKKDLLPLSSLHPGMTVSGKVTKVFAYGALIQTNYDIPGKTRGCVMLHETQMLSNKKPKVGQLIENARVVSVNHAGERVAISLKQAPTKRATAVADLQVGDEVQGKVVRLKQYGAFVDVGLKRNALLHLSRMSMYKVANITDYVNIGQTVQVHVLKINGGDIAVSMLSRDNDAFVDRQDLQRERVAILETLIGAEDEEKVDLAKKQLLDVDRQVWDQFMAKEGAHRTAEM